MTLLRAVEGKTAEKNHAKQAPPAVGKQACYGYVEAELSLVEEDEELSVFDAPSFDAPSELAVDELLSFVSGVLLPLLLSPSGLLLAPLLL
jgi:hypothetical protein